MRNWEKYGVSAETLFSYTLPIILQRYKDPKSKKGPFELPVSSQLLVCCLCATVQHLHKDSTPIKFAEFYCRKVVATENKATHFSEQEEKLP